MLRGRVFVGGWGQWRDGVRLIVDVCRAEFLLPGLVLGCIMCMSGGSYDGDA